MLRAAFLFLVIGIIFAILGFGGIAGAFIGVAKLLFLIAIAIFLILLVLALAIGKKVADKL